VPFGARARSASPAGWSPWLFFFATPAPAQVFRLGTWQGSVDASVDTARVEIERGNSETTNRNRIAEASVTLRNANAVIVDPRLMTLTFGGTLGLAQGRTKTTVDGSSTEQDRDTDLNAYDVATNILPGNSKFSVNLFTNRNRFLERRELAGVTEFDLRNRGVGFSALRLPLPSTLNIRQESNKSKSATGAIVSATDERRDILNYEGRRGWENGVAILQILAVDKSDDIRPELDYESRRGNLSTSMDFGRGLNNRWDQTITLLSREGFSAEDRLDVDQRVSIRHGARLRTDYEYRLFDSERDTGDLTRNTGSFALNHQLYESLSTTVQLRALDETFDTGGREVTQGTVGFGYRKRLPRAGLLNADLRLARIWEDDDFDEAFVSQEPHVVGPPGTNVTLDNPNVIASSVAVFLTVSAPTAPVGSGCTRPTSVPVLLLEGVDYTLQTIGNQTEIVPIRTCTAGNDGMVENDTIAVDYRFTRGGEPVSFTTDELQFNVSVDYGWIRPFYRHEQTKQDLVEGTDDSFLTDDERDTLGLELRYSGARWRLGLVVAAERFESTNQDWDELRATQSFSYLVKRNMTLNVSGNQGFKDFSAPESRDQDTVSVRAGLGFVPKPNLLTDFFLNARDLKDSLGGDERTIELGAQASWRLGKLSVTPSLKLVRIEREGTDSQELRFFVRVSRALF
jgi:hypothetical protein